MKEVIKYDYLIEEDNIQVLYTLDNELDDTPKFGVFNAD